VSRYFYCDHIATIGRYFFSGGAVKFALPSILKEALNRLSCLEFHPFRLWRIMYNRPQLYRLMRLERRRNLLAVAAVLIRHMDSAQSSKRTKER
jgi:hypothetical protein